MNDEQEKNLQDVLRETPWSKILVPFALALLVIFITLIAVVAQ